MTDTMTIVGTWVAALLTLAIFSFLYRENPVYRAAEHILVGIATAYSVLVMYFQVFKPYVWSALLEPKDTASFVWTLLFTLLALLFLAPFVPKIGWLARIPSAIAVGYAAGQALPAAIQARIYPQMLDTVSVFNDAAGFWGVVNALIILVGTVAVLFYFMMTFQRNPVMNGVSRIGVVFLMIGFGAVFGNMVLSRMTILIGRLQFLFGDWIPLIPS
ncbi:MAG: hypothetical protein O3A46_08765 [Candidatus Poribacteria bacterium]|nr:hypothetical protein [Candidatus Poribacteria bacterium]